MKRRGLFVGLFLMAVSSVFGRLARGAVDDIPQRHRKLLDYRLMPDGSIRFYGMFGERGVSVTAQELNWWALTHNGVIEYDQFLSWKLSHPAEDYCRWEDGGRCQDRLYMLGDDSRPFGAEATRQ